MTMAKRELKIKNFRNIGVKKDDVSLLLNHSSKLGEIGDLVYLIGPNNSGKSNLLDCVSYLGNEEKKIATKDKPDYLDEENLEPEISLCVEDEYGLFKFVLTTSKYTSSFSLIEEFEKERFKDYFEMVSFAIKSISDILKNYHLLFETENDSRLSEIKKLETTLFKPNDTLNNVIMNEKQFCQIIDSLCKLLTLQKAALNEQSSLLASLDESSRSKMTSIIKNPKYVSIENNDYPLTLFSDIHGYNICPKVYRYEETPITKKDLKTTIENIDSSSLLSSLFKYLNIKREDVIKRYESYKQTLNAAVLKYLDRKYKDKMAQISDRFNQIYASSSVKYSFELSFYPESINFSMNYGNSDINIDKQSTGFKWFFNFFFNFMYKNKLQAGDILIMDEPGQCLHVSGQEELRGVLKDFAVDNNITVLIATHSPFLVSPDFFDEVRVVDRTSEKDTLIHNNFETANRIDKNDTIYPIVKAFTTYSSVIFNPKYKKYFVEGITDYNYLVAFKRKFQNSNLVFIPFNGVGKKEQQMKETCQRLVDNIECCNVLVDGDDSGKQFAKCVEKFPNLKVKTLTEIDDNWKTIEDLFSEEDKAKFDLKAKYKNKGSEESARFKNALIYDHIMVSDQTQNNFKKLLEELSK